MRTLMKICGVMLALAAALWVGYVAGRGVGGHAAGDAGSAEEKQMYTCGMHPQVLQDHPGNCPICGMKLTPVLGGAGDGGGILIDPVTVQNMGLRTAVLTNGPLRRQVRTVGTVDYEEPSLADVTTKYEGWVEELLVDAVGASVHRGDPLFRVYSPELYSAQQEYLLALKSGGAASDLREIARTKLRYWDISDDQVAELERTGRPAKTLEVRAPIDGFVLEKRVVEGQRVMAGEALYRLADLALVWVHAEVYEQELPFVQLGQEAVVSLSYLPDRKFRGRVTFVYPTVNPETRTARVRMEFHNPGYFLKPGMFASVELVSELSKSALLVPDMAVLRSGERDTVFVSEEGGRFSPRRVRLGLRGENDMLQVLGGLDEGERVVVSGQFLLDSESQLREALVKMGGDGLGEGGFEDAGLEGDSGPGGGGDGRAVYICPMPEHVAIEYDHGGGCPLCGMALVPVSGESLSRVRPGGVVEYYTCPMPEHAEVREAGAGKCPKCRMTLIPVMEEPEPEPEPPGVPAGVTLYTCPMASHAHVVEDHPGKCPECEMVLVETGRVKHGKRSEGIWLRNRAGAGDEAGH